jgi:hypothetical protein
MACMREYPEYKYKEKKVKIQGKEYVAVFPLKHSAVKGVVSECINKNAGDSYANISDYHETLFVLKKGENAWKKLYEGKKNECPKEYELEGYFPLLFSLETDSFRKKWTKNREIKSLKKRIEEVTGKKCILEKRV